MGLPSRNFPKRKPGGTSLASGGSNLALKRFCGEETEFGDGERAIWPKDERRCSLFPDHSKVEKETELLSRESEATLIGGMSQERISR